MERTVPCESKAGLDSYRSTQPPNFSLYVTSSSHHPHNSRRFLPQIISLAFERYPPSWILLPPWIEILRRISGSRIGGIFQLLFVAI
ncbi:hypothetical protein MLD38_035611 [Melastoma candidum]|uniref:Uncharacterized protein n=1 Tax=Melastoma candidum TaxID=119954 RepID=A0ACB9LHF7_9MYRT|nr:hypothetical protein MLD38_035611 [Melastoma candidum]